MEWLERYPVNAVSGTDFSGTLRFLELSELNVHGALESPELPRKLLIRRLGLDPCRKF